MKKRTYTAAVIGLGRIGFSLGLDKKRERPASHTMALMENRRVKIIAGCDTDGSKRAAWKKRCRGAETFPDCENLFSSCSPDIAVVAVNEESHLDVALKAIRAKCRLVILEKPVALNTAEALKIQEAAEKARAGVLVNHERRFARDCAAAKSYVSRIGEIQRADFELCSSLRVFSARDEKTGGCSLMHDGTHLVDLARFLFGAGEGDEFLRSPLITSASRDKNDRSVFRSLSVHFETASCADVVFRINGRSEFFEFGADILGTKGRVKIGNGFAEFSEAKESSLYSGFKSLSRDKKIHVPKRTLCFSGMVENAVAFLDGRAKIGSTLADGISDLRVLEKIAALLKELD